MFDFELTNAQRRCFALMPVESGWDRVEAPPSPYHTHATYAYLDGSIVKKIILVNDQIGFGSPLYREYDCAIPLSEDRACLLPKTEKGKPKKFTAANLMLPKGNGMVLSYGGGIVSVYNSNSEQDYYVSRYEGIRIPLFSDFTAWLDRWCNETGEAEIRDIEAFAARGRVHQKYREGDFFRFRINRNTYGYGRILLNFAQMRKDKIPFWDIFMGKPLCVAAYHIATERSDVPIDELSQLKMLPSCMMMDNTLFYGSYEIIGNRPIPPEETNYPIHYGGSIDMRERTVLRYQCGKTSLAIENGEVLYGGFLFNGIGWLIDVQLPILDECIRQGSNLPYWQQTGSFSRDLRNPIHADKLAEIQEQFSLR